jgi:hypothetical protein
VFAEKHDAASPITIYRRDRLWKMHFTIVSELSKSRAGL